MINGLRLSSRNHGSFSLHYSVSIFLNCSFSGALQQHLSKQNVLGCYFGGDRCVRFCCENCTENLELKTLPGAENYEMNFTVIIGFPTAVKFLLKKGEAK